jgi:hypothetical protein
MLVLDTVSTHYGVTASRSGLSDTRGRRILFALVVQKLLVLTRANNIQFNLGVVAHDILNYHALDAKPTSEHTHLSSKLHFAQDACGY